MKTPISLFFKKFTKDIHTINKLLVSAYVYLNKISVQNNVLIKELIIPQTDSNYNQVQNFMAVLSKNYANFTIEELIELFEFVISPEDKEVNGAVYTPKRVREFIVQQTLNKFPTESWGVLTFADISCGCGGFFISASNYLKQQTSLTYAEIYRQFYGIDIEEYSINRTEILLSLYAIQNGEDIEKFAFNLYCADSLNFEWNTIPVFQRNNGFDIVFGNPPYVSSSKIPESSKQFLSNWSVTKTGKTDLYIPFFQIAIECLKNSGILGYITVNNFYRSVNGRAFRQYMSENKYNFKIIDFGSEQVFRGRATYTCICLIQKNRGEVYYCKSTSNKLEQLSPKHYTSIVYADLTTEKGWLLQDNVISQNIRKIEASGIPLGRAFNIKNGFATLKNDIFILNITKEDECYYYTKNKKGEIFKIEKSICRDVIKPNTLKSEEALSQQIEKLLFPYETSTGLAKVLDETTFQNSYPYAYNYLLYHKNLLSKRDKGKREYEQWFAFGRSQAINVIGYKLLFPYIAEFPHFVFSNKKELLFYNGYALVSEDEHKLKIVQRILRSKIFWYYIQHTSKPYGSNYFALAKNYVKNFGIISMSKDQEAQLLSYTSANDIDNFLVKLYDINI